MKTVSDAFKAHISGGQMTVCYLWKVHRTDGVVFGFTNHDANVTYDAGDGDGLLIYQAATGFANTAASSKSDLSVDNLEAIGFLDADSITEDDMRAGLYDDADIKILLVNWADLTMGHMVVRRGTLGVVKMENGKFTAELRGLAHKLTTQLGDSFGPICRAEFGSGTNGIDMDSRWLCLLDVSLWRQTGVVNSRDAVSFSNLTGDLLMTGSQTPTAAAPDGWFDNGVITFTSGANAGLSFEIKSFVAGLITLFLPAPFPLTVGDSFIIEPGCDKTAGTCTNKFSNIINFRGEPFIPGMDRFLDVPGAGSGIG
jgi:uncharacterized phage protein (TIGR02218 family)